MAEEALAPRVDHTWPRASRRNRNTAVRPMSDKTKTDHKKKGGKGKLILIVGLPLLLLLGGGGAAVFLGFLPPVGQVVAADAADTPKPRNPGEIVFVDLPNLLVNLSLTGTRLRFLKFTASLEVTEQGDAEIVRQLLPRIVDNVHSYLRAIQPEEFEGAQVVYQVKRDLLARINQVIEPARVDDVLIRELLVQ